MKRILLLGLVSLLVMVTPASAIRTTITHTTASITDATGVALAANINRNYLELQNDHATIVIYCKFGAAAAANQGIRIVPVGGRVVYDYKVPTAVVNCIGNAAGPSVLLVAEGTGP